MDGPTLYRRARQIIPGGTQLLSKRPELFLPEHWPAYYSRAKGAEVWDLSGKRYLDMTHNGVGACILGYADDDVDEAVLGAVRDGSMATLNCAEEVELAEELLSLHPWAGAVRYMRTGGEAMAVAVRIVRAHTGRDKIAFCGYHGWHDWYLAANLANEAALDGHLLPGLMPSGVPRALRGTAMAFHYNQIDELREIVDAHGHELAGIVMEPQRDQPPSGGFLEEVRRIATECGIPLVFDEISVGFREVEGGLHLRLGVDPDIAVFAKAMGNGYAIAAVIGRQPVMAAAERSFISSTYWTERIGLRAALATIRKHDECGVGDHVIRIGRRMKNGWASAAADAGVNVSVGGMDAMPHFHFTCDSPNVARTLFTQLMLDRGFLAGAVFYPTYAHSDAQIEEYVAAAAEVFTIISETSTNEGLGARLRGPEAHTGFQRLT